MKPQENTEMFTKIVAAVLPAVITEVFSYVSKQVDEHIIEPLDKENPIKTFFKSEPERKTNNYDAVSQDILDELEIIYARWKPNHLYKGRKMNQKELLTTLNDEYRLNRCNTTIAKMCKGEYVGARLKQSQVSSHN